MKDFSSPFFIKNKNKKRKVFWIFCALALAVFLIVSVSLTLFKVFDKPKDNEKSFFVVLLDTKSSSKSDIESEAQALKTRGGAGVLFFKDTFFVAVSVYENENDAKTIAKSLKTATQEFVVRKFSLNFSKQQPEFCGFLENLLKNLYSLSKDLEKGEKTPVQANLEVRNLLTQTTLNYEKASREGDTFFENVFLNAKSILEYSSSIDILTTSLLPYVSVVRAAEIQILSVGAHHEFL